MKMLALFALLIFYQTGCWAQTWSTYEPTSLGSVQGDSRQIRQTAGNAGGNIVYSNLWLVRHAIGNDWSSALLCDGVSVDANFLNPASNTRTWWKRDFYNNVQTWGNEGNTYLTINQGKVGIGISSPSRELDVAGRMKFRAKGAETSGAWYTGNDGNEALFVGQTGSASSDPFGIYHGGTWRFTLNQNGDIGIGIGVVAPSQKLDIAGRLKFRSDTYNSAGVWFADNAGTHSAFVGLTDLPSTSPLGIYHGGTWRLIVNQDGKVGIGTMNPDQALTVKGNIHTQEVNVDMTVPGPDYVFEKDYNLLPLSELETYINQNKHLPEVPSAKEMEADGLNLKEMNLILLKKVEELTLHLIEVNKAMATQQQLQEKQQKEINNLKRSK